MSATIPPSVLSSLHGYYREWSAFEHNPWRESYREGNGIFERRFVLFIAFFLLLTRAVRRWCDRQTRANTITTASKILSIRPTMIGGTLHALITSMLSVGILASRDAGALALWQTIGLPLSLAYFTTDIYHYCLPRRDKIITFHHLLMCVCHYPVGHSSGALLAGAGDAEWVVWLSLVGYTSEVSTVLMNYRWYLLQTLKDDWIGFGVVNCLVVLSWAARVGLFGYLLFVEILPRSSEYVAAKQVLTFVCMVWGHFAIGVLSLYWLHVMCRGGVKSLFVFQKVSEKERGAVFEFGNDIGRPKKQL